MKTTKIRPEFFLGTVGAQGFHGFFNRLQPEEKLTLYLLKTGPGCGKSTLMRTLAQKETEPAELIHCSSDPKSLDGVLLRGCAVLDATAPHTMEPRCPMLTEHVVSMYDSLDSKILMEKRDIIEAMTAEGKQFHAHAAVSLRAASHLLEDNRNTVSAFMDREKIDRYADRLIRHWLAPKFKTGLARMRFLSAVTPDGFVCFKNTVPTLADTILVFHDEYGACSQYLMELVKTAALKNGYEFYCCPCPLGNGNAEHLIFPELRLALLTSNRWHTFDFEGQKNIHCIRFENKDLVRCNKNKLCFNQKAATALMVQASHLQQEARKCHDQLEEVYHSAVDFSLVNAAAERLEKALRL